MTNYPIWAHVFYLAINISVTIWVARTLFKNGRVFLVDSFLGNEKLADSINQLLVVGFYLVNLGYIAIAVKYGDPPRSLQGAFESVSWKVGSVLLILGTLHFFNLYLFTKTRKRALEDAKRLPSHSSI